MQNEAGLQEQESIALEKVELLSFDSLEMAEDFAKTLEDSGYTALILTESSGDRQMHRVFILIDQGEEHVPGALSGSLPEVTDEHAVMEEKERLYESAQEPLWNVLGRQNRHVHGSLSLSGIYTDNVLNSKDNKESDFSTILSPAIWLVLPYAKEELAPLALSVRSPGGNLISRQWPVSPFHYLASLYYRADIPLTSSSGHLRYGKTPAQTVSGKLLIAGARFSLLAEDQYEFSFSQQEAGDITNVDEIDRYDSNYLGVTLAYDTLNRLLLRGGYSYFLTKYRSDTSDFRDRQDNNFFVSLSYRMSPKMSLLAEYRYFDISYDHASDLDSHEQYLLGGISWDITAKSRGILKLGYGGKDFNHSLGSHDYFTFELQLDHRFTPKTSVTCIAYRKPTETDVRDMAFSMTNGLEVKLQHILTARLSTTAGFIFEQDEYEKTPTATESVDSDIYETYLALQYEFRRWLKAAVGYSYTVKNASPSDLEYRTNTWYFTLTGAM